MVGVVLLLLGQSFGLEPGDLGFDVGVFLRVDPFLVPVSTDPLARTSSDRLEHEFSRVDIAGDLGAVALEVVDEDLGVFSDVTEVYGLTSTLEQQKAVEGLEQKGVRLVDGTEDLLAGSGKLSKESDQVVGGLTVETGSGLVKEEQKIGFGGELYTDGDTLSRFDGKTVATVVSVWPMSVVRRLDSRETNHSIGKVLELQKLDDVLTVGVLLLFRHGLGLTKVGRELQSFSDGRGPLVNILLLGWRSAWMMIDKKNYVP